MKKLSILALSTVAILAGSSCKKYLNVNSNPNSATSSTPTLVLPTSITLTASTQNTYNSYGMEVAGYGTNAGGYGGFGTAWTYNYTTSDWAGLWSSSYYTLNNLQFVLDSTAGKTPYAFYNAIAKILKAYNFQLLVDQYNDVPYSEAFKGLNNLAPAYDKAQTVYQACADLCDSAITLITTGLANSSGIVPSSAVDPCFGGDMNAWLGFANSLKLKLLVRGAASMTFTNTTVDVNNLLNGTDVIINPGYQKASGQLNPNWGSWVSDENANWVGKAWMASTYIMGFYDGTKIVDTFRGQYSYSKFFTSTRGFSGTATAQLGQTINVPNPTGSWGDWFSGSSTTGSFAGIMKGPQMGQPIMLAAEDYFNQAEAALRGIISGDPATLFKQGMVASFKYIYEGADDATNLVGRDPASDVDAYIAENSGNYLVDFSAATTDAEKLEAIITQKYLAMNMITSIEGWNDYRRTGYPKSSGVTTNNAYYSFASTQSISSRADKLPTRIQYPASEFLNNDANVPKGINVFSSLIFWAK